MMFADWYRECRPRLVAALTVLSGDRDAAVDAADEAMVRALERWDRVGEMASPDGWAYRVGVNVLRRRFRRRAWERWLWPRAEPVPAPDLSPAVWEAVKGLPARQREAVALRLRNPAIADTRSG